MALDRANGARQGASGRRLFADRWSASAAKFPERKRQIVPQVLAFPCREHFGDYFPAVGKPRRPLATLARAVGATADNSSSFL
jgi:hypothetical protein